MLMKYMMILAFIATLVSCKKDYACYGEETVAYTFTKSNGSSNDELEREQEFSVIESCMNCSKNDKDKLLQIILDFLAREEADYEQIFVDDGYAVNERIVTENVLICEEQ